MGIDTFYNVVAATANFGNTVLSVLPQLPASPSQTNADADAASEEYLLVNEPNTPETIELVISKKYMIMLFIECHHHFASFLDSMAELEKDTTTTTTNNNANIYNNMKAFNNSNNDNSSYQKYLNKLLVSNPQRLIKLYQATVGLLLVTPEDHTAVYVHWLIVTTIILQTQQQPIFKDPKLIPGYFIKFERHLLSVLLTSKIQRTNKSPSLWMLFKKLITITQIKQLASFNISDINGTTLAKDVCQVVIRSSERHPRNYYAWNFMKWFIHVMLYQYHEIGQEIESMGMPEKTRGMGKAEVEEAKAKEKEALDKERQYLNIIRQIRTDMELYCWGNVSDGSAWWALQELLFPNFNAVKFSLQETDKILIDLNRANRRVLFLQNNDDQKFDVEFLFKRKRIFSDIDNSEFSCNQINKLKEITATGDSAWLFVLSLLSNEDTKARKHTLSQLYNDLRKYENQFATEGNKISVNEETGKVEFPIKFTDTQSMSNLAVQQNASFARQCLRVLKFFEYEWLDESPETTLS